MIVRAYRPTPSEITELSYRRLLVPLDGSQRAECVLSLATTLARSHDAKLLLAHVVSKPEVPRRAPLTDEETELVNRLTELNREKGAQYLKDLKSRLPLQVETRLLVSQDAAATLQSLVEEQEIDLVLLSAHGYTGESKWPYGSIALNFIVYGSTPLLIMQDLPREEIERTQAELVAREEKGH
jgi:nucleotide-binding universal stress UspA family protein